MQIVDFRGDQNEYLLDPKRLIPEAHQVSICKLRQGEQCCRYVFFGENGFVCIKKTPLKKGIDEQIKFMTAKADNCEGLGSIK
jgi:hypothetical protein